MNNFDHRLNELYYQTIIENQLIEEGIMDNIKKWAAISAISVTALIGMFKMGESAHEILSKDPSNISETQLQRFINSLKALEDLPPANLPTTNDVVMPPDPNAQPTITDLPPETRRERNATYEEFKQRISQEEGVRNTVYRDTKGLLTVGIGHLIKRGDKELFEDLFGDNFDYTNLINGRAGLTDAEVNALFEHDLSNKLATVHRQITNFNSFPYYVQIAIVDGYFRGDLPGSPKALGHINAGRWDEVADEYLDNNEYRASKAMGERHGVWQRMDRNAQAYSHYADLVKHKKK